MSMTNPLPVLLRASSRAFPGWSPRRLLLRARMVTAALRALPGWQAMLSGGTASFAGILLAERPEVLGAAIWPYQNATWDARTRLGRIAEHCREVDRLGGAMAFPPGRSIVLADLSERHPDLRLVLDQPSWFIREGGLTLNLFVGSFRAYSIAFSFFRDEDEALSVYVGALQGRRTESALDLYRDLTRALHGMRPRDFLIDCLRMLGRLIHVERLYAVSDSARQHNHAYFGPARTIAADYDLIWRERGGEPAGDGTFRLPLDPARRADSDIKPNKRSLYRQRYAFLDALEREIAETLPTSKPVLLPDS